VISILNIGFLTPKLWFVVSLPVRSWSCCPQSSTAHLRSVEGMGVMTSFCMRCLRHISLRDNDFVLLRELNK
jgi:hypothetical protein